GWGQGLGRGRLRRGAYRGVKRLGVSGLRTLGRSTFAFAERSRYARSVPFGNSRKGTVYKPTNTPRKVAHLGSDGSRLIRRHRQQIGMSLGTLSRRTGIATADLSRIETQQTYLGVDRLTRIVRDGFGVDV